MIMRNQHTRRGNTHNMKNVVNQNKGHSRGILSGISLIPSRCSDLIKAKALCYNNEEAGDPRLQPSGMTFNFITTRGFTLIEPLVVVLIIGLLAAVALPQYQKIARKAQAQEVFVAIDALDKAIHAYYLETGKLFAYTSDGQDNLFEKLTIDTPELKYWLYTRNGAGLPSTTFKNFVSYGSKQHTVLLTPKDHPDRNLLVVANWQDNGTLESVQCISTEPFPACSDYFNCPKPGKFVDAGTMGTIYSYHSTCDLK